MRIDDDGALWMKSSFYTKVDELCVGSDAFSKSLCLAL